MSKHKHRNREPSSENMNNINNMNNMRMNGNNNNPFGIDPFQLMGLFGGNIDMSSIGKILASMNTNGFNLGNLEPLAKLAGFNLGYNWNDNINSVNNMNDVNMMNDIGNLDNMNDINIENNGQFKEDVEDIHVNTNQKKEFRKKSKNRSQEKNKNSTDENLEFLHNLRKCVHPERIKMIDKIIELYINGEFNDI